MTYATIAGHRSMAHDDVRNAAYAAALAGYVRPDSVVLDLGAGTGVLGLLAARAGARHVYLVEPEDIISVAEEIARTNGLDGRVTCLHGTLDAIDLPEPADVIVSAMTGNFLLTEDLLEVLVTARERFLRPGGAVLPSAAVMTAVPVSAPALHAQEIGNWSVARQGLDLSAARACAANTIYYRAELIAGARWLGEPADLAQFDLLTATDFAVHAEVTSLIAEDGMCDGWAGWFRMRLGEAWLSTSPRDPKVHWTAAYLPLDPPLAVRRGETMRLRLDREPHGDWSWQADATSGRRQHSTLVSMPLTRSSLARAARDYRPSLTDAGRVVAAVLEAADGSRTTQEIAQDIQRRFPSRAMTPAGALRLVQAIVKRHG